MLNGVSVAYKKGNGKIGGNCIERERNQWKMWESYFINRGLVVEQLLLRHPKEHIWVMGIITASDQVIT